MPQFNYNNLKLFITFRQIIKYIVLFYISYNLLSCTYETKNNFNETTNPDTTEIIITDYNIKYKLPSPVELYILLKEAKATYQPQSLHNISLYSNYITTESKAINFGIYASDIAYCAVFDKHQEIHQLFNTLKKMGEELGITDGFEKSTIERLDKNLYNSDSLYQITNDSYWNTCKSLEENGNSDVLSKILLGGWIQSMYIAINSVNNFEQQEEIAIRIADQSYLLENLLDYLISISRNTINQNLISKLLDLQYSFDKLYDNPSDVIITKSQFDEISQKIISFRKELIN